MANPKTKLPKVWVDFLSDGMPRISLTHFHRAIQYAPVQPPRKCVWEPSEEMDWWEFSCDPSKVTLDKPRIFCQFCGGRITRRSPR